MGSGKYLTYKFVRFMKEQQKLFIFRSDLTK